MLLAMRASAQPTTPEDGVRARYERGIELYKSTHYEEAILEFKAAYAASDSPLALFNIAQCHRQLGHLPDALTAYRGYLQQQPDAPNRGAVTARIAELERQMLSAPQDTATSAPQPLPERARSRRGLVIGATVSLGVLGTAALAVAGGLSLRAANDEDALQKATPGSVWTPGSQDRYSDGERATNASYGLYAVGGVLEASAIVVAVLGRRSFPRSQQSSQAFAWRF